MPKYYCDYCDTFLTHDSPSVRKTHNGGRKHKENVRMYYQGWMELQAQKLVDATAKAFTQQRMLTNSHMAGQIPMPGRPPVLPPTAMIRPPVQFPYLPQGLPMGIRPGLPPGAPQFPGQIPVPGQIAGVMPGQLPPQLQHMIPPRLPPTS
ncbi:unnamed protein product [Bursaphelenchus okinawaensis]|uniref:U1 small nuclear ribonucleoprotein C n=1 Tax=Bursaphelenchus okinawaensis TaxID=465554 RepID=A0A811KV19_9BILA|nr:unnamed protein product [Bursaphelenchus okinawaensis]CAG9111433.1 unnamed protein product [Bursaphelenchus okinawaensis]